MAAEGPGEATIETVRPRLSPGARITIAYVALFVCFAVTNFTNTLIYKLVRGWFGLGPEWPKASPAIAAVTTTDYYGRFVLASGKDTLFFFSFAVLVALIWRTFPPLWPLLKRRKPWVDILAGLAIASIFIFQIMPLAAGAVHALNSADPFLQEQGFFHRRILLTLLAQWLHLSGVFFVVFFWGLALVTFALTNIYLETKELVLSRIELASLYTVGIFATTLGIPGHAETLVFALTLLAMLDYDRNGRSSLVQAVLFGLALLTHEVAAVAIFGVLALCRFDRRFLMHFVALGALYAIVWLAAFDFDPNEITTAQRAGKAGDLFWFLHHFWLGPLAIVTVYKLTLLAAIVAVARFVMRREYRNAALVVLAIGAGTSLSLLGRISQRRAGGAGDRRGNLAIASRDGLFPLRRVQQLCAADRASRNPAAPLRAPTAGICDRQSGAAVAGRLRVRRRHLSGAVPRRSARRIRNALSVS